MARTLFCGLTGLCGLESLECFGLLDSEDVFRRLDTGVFSTDLKYFSCMESSLAAPPPFPSILVLRGTGCCRGDDIKLPERVSETIGESKQEFIIILNMYMDLNVILVAE